MAACAAPMMEVPESQRLITVSLSKIAASRSQKGGINLHKNLLVATVLTKARAAYMIQHITANKQRAAMAAAPPSSAASSSSSPSLPTCVEMKEQKAEPVSASSSSATSSSSSPAPTAAAPSSPSPFHSSAAATPQSVTPQAETSSVPEGAADSCMQVAEECEDKENTPPPSPAPCRDASPPSPSSLDCEKRLQGEVNVDTVKEGKQALSSVSPIQQQQHNSNNTRDHVNRPSTTCCLLKRRRAMDRDHENVSAPKVRIVEARVTLDTTTSSPEPMQCDSPQISNLVTIFNTSFSGLSGAAGNGEISVRNVGQSILSSVSSHKMSDNLTCAKEMKVGLDSRHQSLVLSV